MMRFKKRWILLMGIILVAIYGVVFSRYSNSKSYYKATLGTNEALGKNCLLKGYTMDDWNRGDAFLKGNQDVEDMMLSKNAKAVQRVYRVEETERNNQSIQVFFRTIGIISIFYSIVLIVAWILDVQNKDYNFLYLFTFGKRVAITKVTDVTSDISAGVHYTDLKSLIQTVISFIVIGGLYIYLDWIYLGSILFS